MQRFKLLWQWIGHKAANCWLVDGIWIILQNQMMMRLLKSWWWWTRSRCDSAQSGWFSGAGLNDLYVNICSYLYLGTYVSTWVCTSMHSYRKLPTAFHSWYFLQKSFAYRCQIIIFRDTEMKKHTRTMKDTLSTEKNMFPVY